ncbi:DUF3055 domain-containing protein [Brevibacillus laterosporus]|uniref:DUF3055 domain-containing protein n=1 Tax=Brevibacillus laterosporus TaxID=1465 RepID=UPI00264B776F|nr:DUF3055 domain-containing protein [Brevibacillus laterosporus]MDN9012210.1 DUF3055 domain-containing protein [Brevibacillus laterosporus]MDO0943306.1 DUF3055 domain-containing protein [Brevibacillus laterosporus]
MEAMELLYDVNEDAKVRFLGYTTDTTRYDFGIVYTHRFFGKPLVVCMQTGQSTLLSSEDTINPKHLQQIFKLSCLTQAKELSQFFRDNLPSMPFQDQY